MGLGQVYPLQRKLTSLSQGASEISLLLAGAQGSKGLTWRWSVIISGVRVACPAKVRVIPSDGPLPPVKLLTLVVHIIPAAPHKRNPHMSADCYWEMPEYSTQQAQL
jgi:hypothetical protein